MRINVCTIDDKAMSTFQAKHTPILHHGKKLLCLNIDS